MKDTKAYFDGRRVWIDGTELFLEFMRRNEYSSGLIKDVIEQVSGKRYLIGPYQKAGKKAAAAAPHRTADAGGVGPVWRAGRI